MEELRSNWKLKQMVEDAIAGRGKVHKPRHRNKTEEEPVVIFCSYLLLQKPFRDNIFGSEKSSGVCVLDLKEIRLQTNFQAACPFCYICNSFEIGMILAV